VIRPVAGTFMPALSGSDASLAHRLGYARVSTDGQTINAQLHQLRVDGFSRLCLIFARKSESGGPSAYPLGLCRTEIAEGFARGQSGVVSDQLLSAVDRARDSA
jgi:hypothetical protein